MTQLYNPKPPSFGRIERGRGRKTKEEYKGGRKNQS